MVSRALAAIGIALLASCRGEAPVADAGPDLSITSRALVTLTAGGTDAGRRPLTYRWALAAKPADSVATLSDPEAADPYFIADKAGTYELTLVVSDGLLDSAPDTVRVTNTGTGPSPLAPKFHAWETLQQQVDSAGSGAVISLDPARTYVLDSSLNLRDYSDITINGNGATILRADAVEVSTALAQDYDGSTDMHLAGVPTNYRVGDYLAIAKGQSVSDVTPDARRITAIDGNRITLERPLGDPGSYSAGDTVFKSYYLIHGMPSHVAGGTNPGVVIENVLFDGNGRNNTINYGWMHNGTIGLHGGKTSEIRYNTFRDIPTENIVGHGFKVHHNTFDGLNGSAVHTSVHDLTKDLNALAEVRDNAIFNPLRIAEGLNGHSEGAITFSWGGGNLTVADNLFVSESGNYGFLGYFYGSAQHTDENLTVTGNSVYNFEYIIIINSPPSTPTSNILITRNLFSNSGTFESLWNVAGNTTIRLGCNTYVNGPAFVPDPTNAACE